MEERIVTKTQKGEGVQILLGVRGSVAEIGKSAFEPKEITLKATCSKIYLSNKIKHL